MKDINFGAGKRILLGMPDWFLYKATREALEHYGFEVIGIAFTDEFTYKSFGDRASNFIRKVFLNDRSYKSVLKHRANGAGIDRTLDEVEGMVDYALLVRADSYPREVIQKIRSLSNMVVGYQWDGLDRYPFIKKLIPSFDRFFIFDPEDSHFPAVLPTTNFFFPSADLYVVQEDIDVYFLGTYVRKRMCKIDALSLYLKNINSNSVIKVYTSEQKINDKYSGKSFEIIDQRVDYETNLSYVRRARILVDFLNDVHQGLSFRIFEAIGYQKKVITNNPAIKKYDFYHPNNFFVLNDDNFEGLAEFIQTPYHALDPLLREKYSFENWIKYLLDIAPYQPIGLPEAD